MRIEVTVTLEDGTVVDRWPAVTAASTGQAVEYLALHFRRLARPVIEAALQQGTLSTTVNMGSSTYTVHATMTAIPARRIEAA